MTGPVYRPDDPHAIGQLFDRVRILEAVVQAPGPPGPYRVYSILSDGTIMADLITDQPARVFGWSYHNENEETYYAKLSNVSTTPGSATLPKVQLGMPPEGSSGHVFGFAGVEFTDGIGFVVEQEIFETFVGIPPPVNTVTVEVYWMLESEV